jgi:urease accessory protein UreF
MQQITINPSETAAALLGDLHPLLDQLGSAEGLVSLASENGLSQGRRVTDFKTLREMLEEYKTRILLAVELPSIYKAYHHASGNETRELIALDQEIGKLGIPRDFAAASQRIGREQLHRLRPLRDERLTQRYLQAVDEARAHGWHTLVYGLTLALYSVPAREGLLNYARQTFSGFIRAAGRTLELPETDCRLLVESISADIPHQLETLLNKVISYRAV